ncbi:MAG: hypothetical protein US74_C0002G0006 [Parcubacteria group bacterium GW2011_GWA2_38_13]|nr:MAG: hypothetical protein US74_C0002G0006 [Parcubacteria group bacterium GW2011_GWA2_38_13]
MDKKNLHFIILLTVILTLIIIAVAHPISASPFNNPLINGITNQLYNTNSVGSSPEYTFIETLGAIVFMLISFLGVIFIVLIMYGGFIWMDAKGNESDVQKAKHIIRDAVVGLIILGSSYGIWIMVYSLLFGEWAAVS